MKKIITTFTVGLTLFSMNLQAQDKKCATMHNLEQRIAKDPTTLLRMEQGEVQTQKWIAEQSQTKKKKVTTFVPVVVHVLWKDTIENISDAQILSQIAVLNDDFKMENSDSLLQSHPFWQFTGGEDVTFCLAQQDTSGNATTGIIRKYTDSVFTELNAPKYTVMGGSDNWNPTKYLNIWVCNLSALVLGLDTGGTLGYATFPSDLATDPDLDGVVCRHEAFGTTGTAGSGAFIGNNLGRTMTHEVGHWLDLRHIWGDNQPNCGDDFVSDTPPAYGPNYNYMFGGNCPVFPLSPNDSCGTDANGQMYMNYMDYLDDACLVMFTEDQMLRMGAAFNGPRSGLATSIGCIPVGISEISYENDIEIYPNPSSGNFTINVYNKLKSNSTNIEVYDLLGSKIQQVANVKSFPFTMNLPELSSGIYYFKINNGEISVTKKVIINK